MKREIWLDMDGTIANLYGVNGWLDDIKNENARPYKEAKGMMNLQALARVLNRLNKNGYEVGIITWLAKGATKEYNEKVAKAKREWLKKHLATVELKKVHIVEYGTPKWTLATDANAILFDDEEKNRTEWKGTAYNVNNMLEVLKAM